MELSASAERLREALHLQAMEGNPLTEEGIAIFEMFQREGWSHQRCTDYLLERARALSAG